MRDILVYHNAIIADGADATKVIQNGIEALIDPEVYALVVSGEATVHAGVDDPVAWQLAAAVRFNAQIDIDARLARVAAEEAEVQAAALQQQQQQQEQGVTDGN